MSKREFARLAKHAVADGNPDLIDAFTTPRERAMDAAKAKRAKKAKKLKKAKSTGHAEKVAALMVSLDAINHAVPAPEAPVADVPTPVAPTVGLGADVLLTATQRVRLEALAQVKTAAGRRAKDALRYLKLHAKKPYGRRGQVGILKIVDEAFAL